MEITKLLDILNSFNRTALIENFADIKIADVLEVCYILDRKRSIKVIGTKLKSVKNPCKVKRLMAELDFYNSFKHETDKTLTKTRKNMIKQWARTLKEEQLNSYVEEDLIKWKKLADMIHFNPRDFTKKDFLSKCFN